MAVMFHGFTVKVDGRTKDAEDTSFICGGQSVNVFLWPLITALCLIALKLRLMAGWGSRPRWTSVARAGTEATVAM